MENNIIEVKKYNDHPNSEGTIILSGMESQVKLYLSMGFSLIPIAYNKKPCLNWKEFQTRRADEAEVMGWLNKWSKTGIGIVTGKISNVVVVDVEVDGSTAGLTPTVIAKSGGGGFHYYYKYPGCEIKNEVRIGGKPVDFRGDGGFIVAPPSTHPSGGRYEWIVPFGAADIVDLPEQFLQKKYPAILPVTKDWPTITQGVSAGSRNNTAASYAGKLLYSLPPELWATAGRDALKVWNERNNPPLPEEELRAVFDSVASIELGKRTVKDIVNVITPAVWKPALSISELATTQYQAPEWVVDRLIPAGGITAFSSPPGMFKSFLLADMAIAVASGQKFLSRFQCKQMAVMLIDEENTKNRIGKRIQLLTDKFGLPIYYHIKEGFLLSNAEFVEAVIKEAKDKGVGLIAIDTLIRVHGSEENSATEMNVVYQQLTKFTQAGFTVIFTHHHKKQGRFPANLGNPQAVSESMRGSTDILGQVDAHWCLMGLKEDQAGKFLTAVQTKVRDDELLPPFKIKVASDEGSMSFTYAGDYDEKMGKVEETKRHILDILADDKSGLSREQLVEQLDDVASDATIRAVLKELKTDGQVVVKTRKELKATGVDKGEGAGKKAFYFPQEQQPHKNKEIIDG